MQNLSSRGGNDMKSIELQPNKENLLRTFELDAIERNVDIYRFINLLNAIEDNCSVALDGAWGSGKTFFVKQTKTQIAIASWTPAR